MATSFAKVPPHDIESEVALLGSLMIDRHAMDKVADSLRPEDFYKHEHATIFEAMQDLFEKNTPIDIVSVKNYLKERGKLDSSGGDEYLVSMVNSVATAAHIPHYADVVRKKRILRSLIDTSLMINELGYQEGGDVEAMLDEAERRIFNIGQSALKQKFVSVGEALGEAWDRIDALHKGDGALRGVPTGFADLDKLLSGLQPSDLIILAARPSLGKTTFALDIARNVAVEKGIPVGIFSLEMSTQQITDRLIASTAEVDLWKLRTGKLNTKSDDFLRVQEALDKLSKAPIFIDDAASNNIMEMRAMARRLKAEHGLGLIIVDYLQLMEGRGKTESRVQEVSEFSRSLKGLAKELDVPIIALSQLSRLVEQRHPPIPRLSDLRESGSIEQDADIVMFIYREDKAKRESTGRDNIAEILVEKHRNGPTGKVELYFNGEKVKFMPLEKYMGEPPSDIHGGPIPPPPPPPPTPNA